MDPASFALSVAGLAGIFTSCVQCFDMVQLGLARDRDVRILHQKLDNQKVRLLTWGESIRLDQEGASCILDPWPLVHNAIKNTLLLVCDLFRDGTKLYTRYGLVQHSNISITHSDALALTGNEASALRLAFQRLSLKFRGQRKQSTYEGSTVRWVIVDQKKYLELVNHLRQLVDDLESMTQSNRRAAQRHREIIVYDISEVAEEELEVVVEAAEDTADLIWDAASDRLESTVASRTIASHGAGLSETTYVTASERRHSSPQVVRRREVRGFIDDFFWDMVAANTQQDEDPRRQDSAPLQGAFVKEGEAVADMRESYSSSDDDSLTTEQLRLGDDPGSISYRCPHWAHSGCSKRTWSKTAIVRHLQSKHSSRMPGDRSRTRRSYYDLLLSDHWGP